MASKYFCQFFTLALKLCFLYLSEVGCLLLLTSKTGWENSHNTTLFFRTSICDMSLLFTQHSSKLKKQNKTEILIILQLSKHLFDFGKLQQPPSIWPLNTWEGSSLLSGWKGHRCSSGKVNSDRLKYKGLGS